MDRYALRVKCLELAAAASVPMDATGILATAQRFIDFIEEKQQPITVIGGGRSATAGGPYHGAGGQIGSGSAAG